MWTGMRRRVRAADRERAPRPVVGIVVVLTAAHMLLTGVFNVPWSEVKYGALPGAVADAYVKPYLVQDYRIFAPEPAHADVSMWVRAQVRSDQGSPQITEWVDVTSAELSSPLWKMMRKHPTAVAAERLLAAYGDLNDGQRRVAARDYLADVDLTGLQADLSATKIEPASLRSFIRATNVTTSYATQVAYAVWDEPDRVLAVQVRVVSSPVVRWADRFDETAQRPAPTVTELGWRPTLEWAEQDRDGFARTFLSWVDES